MNNTIKGITIEIGGDTSKLGKALQNVEKQSKSLSAELGQINRLLKLDPGNTELLAQKQKVLAEAVAAARSAAADCIRQPGEFFKPQLLAPHLRSKTTRGNTAIDLLLCEFTESGAQRIAERFATLGKGCADHPEEHGFILYFDWWLVQHIQFYHRGCHLWCREEAFPRHFKEIFAVSVILAQQGKSAEVRRTRRGADALGHFLLDHDRDGPECTALQQLSNDRGGEITGQIGADNGAQSVRLLVHQCGAVGFRHISRVLHEHL